MIIDLILDRYDGSEYNAREFYHEVMAYDLQPYSDKISRAMDGGTNEDVQRALVSYIFEQGYNTKIVEFIMACDWLENAPAINYRKKIKLHDNKIFKLFEEVYKEQENKRKLILDFFAKNKEYSFNLIIDGIMIKKGDEYIGIITIFGEKLEWINVFTKTGKRISKGE